MTTMLDTGTTALATPPSLDALGREPLERVRAKTAPVLVATNGDAEGDAAVHIARLLAGRLGRALELVVVDESSPSRASGFVLPARSLLDDLVDDTGPLAEVRRQARNILAGEAWRVHVEFGNVGSTIARVAQDEHASIIVMGIGKHNVADRLFGSETVARVLREASVPVLAVHPSAATLPRRAAVGLDFSPTSLRAARATVEVLDRPGVLLLAHVDTGAAPDSSSAAALEHVYERGVSRLLDELVAEVSNDGLVVETRMASGRVVRQLERMAEIEKLDLLAVGSHGPHMLERILLGSVPLQLLRTARCSVLVAPPRKD